MVRYVGKVAEPVARYLPERPRFMAEMPMVRELVDNQLTFRRRVVDEQAAFVTKMMKAMKPMLAKVDGAPPGLKGAGGAPPGRMAGAKPAAKATHAAA